MDIRSCLVVPILLFTASALMADEPKPVQKAMKRGEQLLVAGDIDGAIAAYSEAIRLDPRNAEAYKERARTYAVRAAPERFPYLWTVWPPGVLDRQRHHGTQLLLDARKNQIADLTEAIRLVPNDVYTYFGRAYVYEEQGNIDKAISDYTEVIRLASLKNADTHLHIDALRARAWLYGTKGELGKAIADYTEAIRRNSQKAYVFCCRAGMYERKNDLDKAVADYTEAVQLSPDNAYMFAGRARLNSKKGESDKVIADCSDAIRLKPDFAAAYALRCAAYAKKGDHDAAGKDRDLAARLGANGTAAQDIDAAVTIVRNHVGELSVANPLVSKYVPSIDNGNGSHRFSDAQLKEMAKTALDRRLFLRYVEAKWPLSRLKAFCTKGNLRPEGYQNLVPHSLCFNEWETPVHKGKQHEFDKVYVYVSEDDGKSNYYGSVTPDWRRWEYSLNVVRGKDHWAIIESLPNDFVDNPGKYLPQQAVEGK